MFSKPTHTARRLLPMPLSDRLSEYVRACFTGIWIESHEHDDALQEIASLCRQEQWRLLTWDIDQGLKVQAADQTQVVETESSSQNSSSPPPAASTAIGWR